MKDELITLQFDGGSRGNPGPAGIGVVLRAEDGTPLVTLGRFIGRATNNVAEYKALITGLREARKLGVRRLKVLGDSELIVKQMLGEYRVKNPDLQVLHREARALCEQFESAGIGHNYRADNSLADRLANLAMDRKADVTDVDEGPLDAPTPDVLATGDQVVCPRCGCAVQIVKPSGVRPHQLKPFTCQCGNKMDRPSRPALD
jgi:ribonuclease HI